METTIIGIDRAKSVFQLHAEDRTGTVLARLSQLVVQNRISH